MYSYNIPMAVKINTLISRPFFSLRLPEYPLGVGFDLFYQLKPGPLARWEKYRSASNRIFLFLSSVCHSALRAPCVPMGIEQLPL
jgi:hypothetical protein